LTLAEQLQLPEVFVDALISKGLVLSVQGRLGEARILLEAAMRRAHAEDLPAGELRAGNNLGAAIEASDRYAEAFDLAEKLIPLARRRGDRRWESALHAGVVVQLVLLGRWEEAIHIDTEVRPHAVGEFLLASLLWVALIGYERGELEEADARLHELESVRESANIQFRINFAVIEARSLRAHGHFTEALGVAQHALDDALGAEVSIVDTSMKVALVEAVEAALALGDLDAAERLLALPEALSPGQLTPLLQANAARLRARLDAARGEHDGVDERFRLAENMCSEFSLVFQQAVAQLEHAEWLAGRGRALEANALAAEAEETFEQLRAAPWIERAHRMRVSSFA
jgi:tetratricopeptide (TPR) repeat protein